MVSIQTSHFLLLCLVVILPLTQCKVIRGSSGASVDSNLPQVSTDCDFTYEVLLVQDSTNSYEDDLLNLADQAAEFMQVLEEIRPGSKFGVAVFGDKPLGPSSAGDICYKSILPIGSTADEIKSALLSTRVGGGWDAAENMLGGMMRGILTNKTGWSEHEGDLPVVRVVIGSSDAFSHWEPDFGRQYQRNNGDLFDAAYEPSVPFANVIAESGALNKDENAYCVESEYPKLQDFGDVVRRAGVIPILLTGNWTFEVSGTLYYDRSFREVAFSLGQDSWLPVDTGLSAYMETMLHWSHLDGLVLPIDSQSKNFTDVLCPELCETIPDLICESPTTTTTVITTATPTAANRHIN